jgi:hypothetical protein
MKGIELFQQTIISFKDKKVQQRLVKVEDVFIKHQHVFQTYKKRVADDIPPERRGDQRPYHYKQFYLIYGKCACGHEKLIDYRGE